MKKERLNVSDTNDPEETVRRTYPMSLYQILAYLQTIRTNRELMESKGTLIIHCEDGDIMVCEDKSMVSVDLEGFRKADAAATKQGQPTARDDEHALGAQELPGAGPLSDEVKMADDDDVGPEAHGGHYQTSKKKKSR